jgi:chromosome segregation ATPase
LHGLPVEPNPFAELPAESQPLAPLANESSNREAQLRIGELERQVSGLESLNSQLKDRLKEANETILAKDERIAGQDKESTKTQTELERARESLQEREDEVAEIEKEVRSNQQRHDQTLLDIETAIENLLAECEAISAEKPPPQAARSRPTLELK